MSSSGSCSRGEEAWFVGGAVRDELLGRPLVDVDVVCADPEGAARRYARRSGGAPFPLSERARRLARRARRRPNRRLHAAAGRLDRGRSRAARLHVNAIAVAGRGRPAARPASTAAATSSGGRCGAVSDGVFDDDPLRLLRAVRLEDELGLRLDEQTERLVRERAGARLAAFGRADPRRAAAAVARRAGCASTSSACSAALGGSTRAAARGRPRRLAASSGSSPPSAPSLRRLPISNELRRYARSAAARRAARGRVAARDPPLPPRDRAVRARRARLRPCGRARRRGARRARRPSRPSRSSAATSSGCLPGPADRTVCSS